MKIQRVINGTYEEEVALIDIETNELLLKGDAYHDKIDKNEHEYKIEAWYKRGCESWCMSGCRKYVNKERLS